MKIINHIIYLFLIVVIAACNTPGPQKGENWIAMHFLNYNSNEDLENLGGKIPALAEKGINVCVLEVDYHFNYKSHPELIQDDNPITIEGAQKFEKLCRDNEMKLFIEFQVLGHQSWAKETFPLLTVYPEFDITPGEFPENSGPIKFDFRDWDPDYPGVNSFYCREWDPMNPKIPEIIFSLLDELIDAFDADGIHVGMDEVFLLGNEKSPSTEGMDPAELYAKVIEEFHNHIVIEKGLEMMMWADRLIDSKIHTYGEWEASAYGTAAAIDMIPKDIIMCDWHYEALENYGMEDYSSIKMFLDKGFRVLPTSWRRVETCRALINSSLKYDNENMLGHLFTAWGKYRDPVNYAPMIAGIELLKAEKY